MLAKYKSRTTQLSTYRSPYSSSNTVLNFMNRYTPPPVPSGFEQYNLMDDEHNHPKHHNEKSTLFTSQYNCIKKLPDHSNQTKTGAHHAKLWESLYSHCNLENVCMNRRGEWILFLNDEGNEHEKFNQNYLVITSAFRLIFDEHAKFKVKAVKPLLKNEELKLAAKFNWIQKPTFAFSRYATANAGHMIMDNLLSVFNQMVNFEYVNSDHFILFLDDPYNGETGRLSRAGNTADRTENFSLEWAKLFSSNQPLQLCYDIVRNQHYIGNSPCRQDDLPKKERQKLSGPEGDEIQSCFSSLIVGSPESHFFDLYGREMIFSFFRNYLMTHTGVLESTKFSHQYSSMKLKIAIQKKPPSTSRTKDTIINTSEIEKYFVEKKMEILSTLNKLYGRTRFNEIEIIELKLEVFTPLQQLHFFKDLDVYITTQGSASYMSMFMQKPNSLLFFSPLCKKDKLVCSDYNIRVHKILTNIKTISLVDYTHIFQCIKDNDPQGQGYPVTKFVNPEKEVTYYGDCNLRYDPAMLYSIVLENLKIVHGANTR